MFDWHEKDKEHRCFYNEMLELLNCSLEDENGNVLRRYTCELSGCGEGNAFHESTVCLSIEKLCNDFIYLAGAQLALDMVQQFMEGHQWHMGFWDAQGALVNDIATWSKSNVLDPDAIIPVVWFGLPDDIVECWSITPNTTDSFIHEFWSDYFNEALPYICDADNDLYITDWEYPLDYDASVFDTIKSLCPINIDLPEEERTEALYHLIISVYNKNKI